MHTYFVTIAVAMVVPSTIWARSDAIPNLDVRPVCRGIASQSAEPSGAGLKTTFEECVKSEHSVLEQLKREWPKFSAADKQHCVALATTGGESSNTELLTCLEMSRDVRALRSPATGTAQPGAQRSQGASSSAPSLTPGPANLGKASQATAKDSTVSETAQLTKDLQLAKADAQTAKQSEASAQRKLADAEAALQRAREEARRATAEAEQAKADAKTAQKSEETTKRKLADAEAARVAAEGRVRTCENANKEGNKPEPSLGERFRSWFGIGTPDKTR
jgi:hypothetical protein